MTSLTDTKKLSNLKYFLYKNNPINFVSHYISNKFGMQITPIKKNKRYITPQRDEYRRYVKK